MRYCAIFSWHTVAILSTVCYSIYVDEHVTQQAWHHTYADGIAGCFYARHDRRHDLADVCATHWPDNPRRHR